MVGSHPYREGKKIGQRKIHVIFALLGYGDIISRPTGALRNFVFRWDCTFEQSRHQASKLFHVSPVLTLVFPSRSVLDGAAAEGDALADMQGSTQDFVLHSSEEEEEEDGEDSDYLTQRMPESAMSQGLGPKTVSVDTHRASSGVLNGTHVTENHSRREKIARNPNIQTSSVLESSGEQVRRRDGGDEKDDSDGTESLIKHYMVRITLIK